MLSHLLMFLSLLFDAAKSNQKRLDDLNALRLPASLERKIVKKVCFACINGLTPVAIFVSHV